MISKAAKKRESGGTVTKVYEDNRYYRKRKSKRKRVEVRAEKIK